MKKTVLTFGFISGAILSAMMFATTPFHDKIGYDKGEVIGYTTMILSFLFIFFGIRSYRENIGGGLVSFGRALKVGAGIALIASICYVATWEIIYYNFVPDFMDKYGAHVLQKMQAAGATAAAIQQKSVELNKLKVMYKNPFVNMAMTFARTGRSMKNFEIIGQGPLRQSVSSVAARSCCREPLS